MTEPARVLRRVLWTVLDPLTRVPMRTLPAVVIRESTKQAYIRATLPSGALAFRWVPHGEIREADRAEP